jgi:hypothetical protein
VLHLGAVLLTVLHLDAVLLTVLRLGAVLLTVLRLGAVLLTVLRLGAVLLTVLRLGAVPVNNQLDALIQCIYLFHFSTCFEQPSAHHQENQLYQYIIWYVLACVSDCLVCPSGAVTYTPVIHTR